MLTVFPNLYPYIAARGHPDVTRWFLDFTFWSFSVSVLATAMFFGAITYHIMEKLWLHDGSVLAVVVAPSASHERQS